MNIVVLATADRTPIIAEYLKDVELTIHMNWRHTYPGPQENSWLGNPYDYGHYQCYQGHYQIAQTIKEPTLVLEDDAKPINPDWLTVVERAERLLNHGYDVVSLHSRMDEKHPAALTHSWFDDYSEVLPMEVTQDRFKGHTFTGKWLLGSLAYLITPEAAKRLPAWNGTPLDITLCNNFSFAFIKNSPFEHDRSQGSLVESRIK
jgi:hypothetical protein